LKECSEEEKGRRGEGVKRRKGEREMERNNSSVRSEILVTKNLKIDQTPKG
jgi:hypothetical protein